VRAAERATGVDLEALELAIREAALQAGARVLEGLLEEVGVANTPCAVRAAR
jgi:hypothetical protein